MTIGRGNVSPFPAEELLLRHPAVAEAAVVGVPDPVLGHRLVANLVTQSPCTSAELRRWCADGLGAAERPSTFEFRTELPRLPGGKVDRRVLRERSSEQSLAHGGAVQSPAAGRDVLSVVRSVWRAVLAGESPDDDEDLSPAGSFSLLATDVAGRLSVALQHRVTPGVVIGHPCISALAAELDDRLSAGTLAPQVTVQRAPRPSL